MVTVSPRQSNQSFLSVPSEQFKLSYILEKATKKSQTHTHKESRFQDHQQRLINSRNYCFQHKTPTTNGNGAGPRRCHYRLSCTLETTTGMLIKSHRGCDLFVRCSWRFKITFCGSKHNCQHKHVCKLHCLLSPMCDFIVSRCNIFC